MAANPDHKPNVNSIKDLHILGEAFNTVDGQRRLKYTFFCYIDSNHFAYFGHSSVHKRDLTGEILQERLEPIPDREIYPQLPTNTTVFSGSAVDGFHVKHADLKLWDDYTGQDYIANLLLGEVEALEYLRLHPHPNIISYHGCIVHRKRITAMVLDRCTETLEERLKTGPDNLDKNSIFEGIKSAIEHLHSLGLAHNDLKPANIMLDENDQPILIDFGSCKAIGELLQEVGTEGWRDEYHWRSEKKHDLGALQKIEKWMKGEKDT